MDSLDLGNFFVCGEVASIYDKVAIGEHFENLCAKVGVECKEHLARAQAATQARDWVAAYSEWTSCRDVIVRSEGVFDRDDWLWFSGCHALVWANLWAFYSMNFGLALTAAIAACKARDEVQNVPEALDFESYLLPTLWKVMYLWASTSDCEEEALDPDVKAFLIDVLGHSRDAVSDSDVRKLKSQCKEFVINKSESIIWEVQKHFFAYSQTEECLRWAREGNKLYRERYAGKLDYVSKFNEAFTLFMKGACKGASEVLEEIKEKLDSEPWKAKVTNVHPAAQYCNLEYEFHIQQMLITCYQQRAVQSGPGKERNFFIEVVNKEQDEFQSLLAQSEWDKTFSKARECLAEALEHAENKWEKGYEKWSGTSMGQSIWVRFLNNLHEFFRNEYRKSYERGLPDESHFSNAKSCAMKLLESNFFSLCPLSHFQTCTFLKLVRLYHEKDRQVMFLKQSSNMVDVTETAPILQYGRKAIDCYVKALIQHSKDDDYWRTVQELYKDLYYMLQFHNFALWIERHSCTLDSTCDIAFPDRLQKLWNQSLMSEGASAESSVSQEIWKQSLIWAERRVAKTIYFQLDPNMLSRSAMKQLCVFDLKDDVAWNTLKSSRAACGPGTFVLEYFVSEKNDLQFVYVMTKEDEVFMQILILKMNGLDSILWKILECLRNMFSQGSHECERAPINETLEWLYEILISPVANFLDDMELEDKLIIVAPEILSDVPFAALRKPNSPVGEGYLIQSHTISVTPSLRTLQDCDHKWKELDQNFLLDTNPGTIVAVAEPAYEKNGKETEVPKMSPMGEEVNFIEELFGEGHVKKLVGPEATPSEVLKWAKYPSEHLVKQVVFHIAAHAIGQDDRQKVKKGAILLARPASSCQQNYDTAGQGATRTAQDNENFDNDNAHDETELGDLFSMVDGKEEAQISSHGEVGGIRTGFVCPISKLAPHILKSENISGCGFPWKAHMVVLGACDTARGHITGEGVLNLPQALMIAGVPCVVVSQWKVGDSSTCELMKGFYQELRCGKDVSSSLRAAMLKMIKDGARVHEWAPFFVCGLPTVCLPKELQTGTSSCKVHDRGTSSDTKAELRVKALAVMDDCMAVRALGVMDDGDARALGGGLVVNNSLQGLVSMPGSKTYDTYQVNSLEHSLYSSGMLPDEAPSFHSLQQLRDGSDPSTVGALVGSTTTQDFSTQTTTPGMGSGKDSQLESHEAADEMNEPSKLEPNCGASSSRSLPPILQQSLKETAGGTTNLGKADIESEQIDIELEACVQQDGNGKQCKDEAAGRQAQKLLSSIHQRLQGLERAIGVIPTPAEYVVEDHCVEHDSESVITFGWRVASEANALELLFRSKEGMSSILGVGIEFAKVLVVPASLEVKIIGIGHASWNALWQDSSNNKDDLFDIVSIGGVRRAGAKLENPSNVEYLTAKQSATKYGVGLQDRSNTAHVNSTDVQPQSDCSCILDKVLEYLVLKKVIDAIVDKQCDGDGGEGSSSGVNGTKQDIGGRSSSQSTLSLPMSYFPSHEAQKPTGGSDDDDDDETLPSREGPHQVNHKRPKGNFCRVTVHPGPGGSFDPRFDPAGTPQELGTTSIDPTLVFEFNYKLDMNEIICDKQIHITTTTAFDLGEAAPTELMSDSFGWYQNPMEVSLRNCGDAKLHSCQLKETLKETKISAKTTHTHSKNSTSQRAAQVQGGYKTFFQVTRSANRTTSNGERIAKEKASENLVFEVLKGFQHQDLRVGLNSLLKYRFFRLHPAIEVLEDPEERHKCLGMGMCEAVVPTCIGTWLITAEDVNEHSPYLFEAERTLNRIFKVDQGSTRREHFFKRILNHIFKVGQGSERREKFVQCCHEEFVQHYRVPIYVNHAMSHLRALKDDHKLEGRKLSNVLEVGIVGI